MSNGTPESARGARVVAAERTDRVAGAEQPGVEEIRAHAAGLQLELAEAQHAEVEAEPDEVGLVHGARTLYCATMRIITLNANGIRSAARKGFFDWLQRQDADVVCVQETKCQREQLTDPLFCPAGYHCYYFDATKKGYSGVAVYSRVKPDDVVDRLRLAASSTPKAATSRRSSRS